MVTSAVFTKERLQGGAAVVATAIVVWLAAAAVNWVINQPVAVIPPATLVQQTYVAKCVADIGSCYGDYVYLRNDKGPYLVVPSSQSSSELLSVDRMHMLVVQAHGHEGKFERIVQLDGDPAAYAAAARQRYGRQ